MVYLCPEPLHPLLCTWVHAPLKRPFRAEGTALRPLRPACDPAWRPLLQLISLVPSLFSNTGKKLLFYEAAPGSARSCFPGTSCLTQIHFYTNSLHVCTFLGPQGQDRTWATPGHPESLPIPRAVPPFPSPSPDPHPRPRTPRLGEGRRAIKDALGTEGHPTCDFLVTLP